jgi:phage major head subunit gpT-like protein
MLINSTNLNAMYTGFKTAFNTAFSGAETFYKRVAMVVTSSSREENYGWMNQQSGLREWIGDRVVKSLSLSSFTIKNRKFEDTIGVSREDIEDDRIGVLTPFVSEMGRAAAEHPDQLIAELLKTGFTAPCYDEQNFFDTDHPVGEGAAAVPVSNMQDGAGAPWFLLDTSRAVRPLVFQQRVAPVFTALNRENDQNVFLDDEYLYGIRARANAGFGLWQLAYASKAELTPANYEAARAAMMAFKGDGGRPLGVKPNVLIVPPSLEGAAMRLLNNGTRVENVDTGSGIVPVALQNEWAKTAEPIITPWLA